MKELSEYTDEELRQEMKRRVAEQKAQQASIPICRNCQFFRVGDNGYSERDICSIHTYVNKKHNLLCHYIAKGYKKACKDFKLNENI